METRLFSSHLSSFKNLRVFVHGLAVDRVGMVDGLLVLWHNTLDLTLITMSLGHIDVMIKQHKNPEILFFTRFYGYWCGSKCYQSCELL